LGGMNEPIFCFGVIADVQYADIEDGWDFHHIQQRRYRGALGILKEAAQKWKLQGISLVVQLGDIIDGKCAIFKQTASAFAQVQAQLEGFTVHNLIGNHELYNFTRSQYDQFLNSNPDRSDNSGVLYYHFSPHPGWRFVFLDPYEFSILNPDTRSDAVTYLRQYNPNDVERNVDWIGGLYGLDRRFVPYNGLISSTQLAWLRLVLENATSNQEKVLIMSHIPVCPGSCQDTTLLWNYDEVLAILHQFPCIKAFLAGHDHSGGYKEDDHHIHHKTFESPLEAPEGSSAFGIIHVYTDKLVLHGEGTVESNTWLL